MGASVVPVSHVMELLAIPEDLQLLISSVPSSFFLCRTLRPVLPSSAWTCNSPGGLKDGRLAAHHFRIQPSQRVPFRGGPGPLGGSRRRGRIRWGLKGRLMKYFEYKYSYRYS